jgi:energy-coupling factor transporter ATP-binding protein EcfA2
LPWPLRDKLVRDLSGGEKQRVALVMALLLQRPLLLLDEASSALDREAREAVTEYVAALPDVAVLAVAHDPTGFWFPDRLFRLGQRREEV